MFQVSLVGLVHDWPLNNHLGFCSKLNHTPRNLCDVVALRSMQLRTSLASPAAAAMISTAAVASVAVSQSTSVPAVPSPWLSFPEASANQSPAGQCVQQTLQSHEPYLHTTCRLCPTFAGPRGCGPSLRYAASTYSRFNFRSTDPTPAAPWSLYWFVCRRQNRPSFATALHPQDCTPPFFHRCFAPELPNPHSSRLLLGSNLHLPATVVLRCATET